MFPREEHPVRKKRNELRNRTRESIFFRSYFLAISHLPFIVRGLYAVPSYDKRLIYFNTLGINTLIILIAAGPNMVIKRVGRINNIKGNTNLTGSLAAASSAFWYLLVLMNSE
jgi:hypothetical protein